MIAYVACASAAAFAQLPNASSAAKAPARSAEPALTAEQRAIVARQDEFQTAVAKGDVAQLKAMVRAGMPVDFNFNDVHPGRTGESPLTMSIHRDHLEIAKALLEAGANPNRMDGSGRPAIHGVISIGAVQLLVRYGADINLPDRQGFTALADAVERGENAKVEMLLANGATAGSSSKAPDLFALAVKQRHPELIPAMLARGIDPRSPPTEALWLLIENGDAESARLLLGKGADPNARNDREWLITRALFRQRWDIVAMLLDAGANVRLPDSPSCASRGDGCFSIEPARLASLHPPTLARLKAGGVDLDAYAPNGLTALTSLISDRTMVVMARGRSGPGARIPAPDNVARVRAVLEQGADPNLPYRGLTPLMLAISMPDKSAAFADTLVEFGARVDHRSVIAKQPFDQLPPAGFPLPASASVAAQMSSGPLVHNNLGLYTDMTTGPLTWLVFYRRADIAARILSRERKIEPEDRYLPYFAGLVGEWDLVLQALPYLKEVNASDRAGVTPLMLAAEDGRADAVTALLAAGARVDAQSASRWPPVLETPPSMFFGGHGPTPPRLVGGYTALKAARSRGHEEVAKILIKAGARE